MSNLNTATAKTVDFTSTLTCNGWAIKASAPAPGAAFIYVVISRGERIAVFCDGVERVFNYGGEGYAFAEEVRFEGCPLVRALHFIHLQGE